MNFFIEIHRPLYTSHTVEVIAFPEDDDCPPFTIAHLPVQADEGDMEIVIPESDEFDGDIFIFEFFGGQWQQCRDDEDADMSLALLG